MLLPLQRTVRVAAEQNHPNRAEYEGRGGQQAGLEIADSEALDDGWQEKGDAVAGSIQAEIHERAGPDPPIAERFADAQVPGGVFLLLLRSDNEFAARARSDADARRLTTTPASGRSMRRLWSLRLAGPRHSVGAAISQLG